MSCRSSTLMGHNGHDTLGGGTGNDRYTGGPGMDTLDNCETENL
jgi:Ca2+-binding RTX toxin-like protein